MDQQKIKKRFVVGLVLFLGVFLLVYLVSMNKAGVIRLQWGHKVLVSQQTASGTIQASIPVEDALILMQSTVSGHFQALQNAVGEKFAEQDERLKKLEALLPPQ